MIFGIAWENLAKKWQLPYTFAAVDGSHLPIKCPQGGAQAMKQYLKVFTRLF